MRPLLLLFTLLIAIPAHAEDALPIIDMHLHSYAIDPSWDLDYFWLPEGFEAPASGELLMQATQSGPLVGQVIRHGVRLLLPRTACTYLLPCDASFVSACHTVGRGIFL